MRVLWFAALLYALAIPRSAGAAKVGGHLKVQGLMQNYHADDAGALTAGRHPDLESLDVRENFAWLHGPWNLTVQTQLDYLHGNLLASSAESNPAGTGTLQLFLPAASESRQVFDLSWNLSDGPRHQLYLRLDRISLGYTKGALALRVGRQALSWGGGLFFHVFDLFDPFPPDALDTEYKPGIDMASAQWLFLGGDDLQAIVVPRRADRNEPLTLAQSSAALKWRHFAGSSQLELLAARHYQDTVTGLGLSGNVAGAVWRWDLTSTFPDHGEVVVSFLANLDRSWILGGRNLEAYLECFRNGFGTRSLDGEIETLSPALLRRLDRGELFNLGRHELALGARYEWSPLTTLEPAALVNLDDASIYLLLHLHHSLQQDLDLDAGVQLPLGGRGSEYGGVRLALLDAYLAPPQTVWIRLARYF